MKTILHVKNFIFSCFSGTGFWVTTFLWIIFFQLYLIVTAPLCNYGLLTENICDNPYLVSFGAISSIAYSQDWVFVSFFIVLMVYGAVKYARALKKETKNFPVSIILIRFLICFIVLFKSTGDLPTPFFANVIFIIIFYLLLQTIRDYFKMCLLKDNVVLFFKEFLWICTILFITYNFSYYYVTRNFNKMMVSQVKNISFDCCTYELNFYGLNLKSVEKRPPACIVKPELIKNCKLIDPVGNNFSQNKYPKFFREQLLYGEAGK